MISQKEKYISTLEKFLPTGTENYIAGLIISCKTHFKISAKRKTKLGDYRMPHDGKGHRISVNGDLNEYAFLVTTVHEFAHLKAFEDFGKRIKPHGIEWQKSFAELFQPILQLKILPTDVTLALNNYLKKAKASSCTDDALYRVLKRYDKEQHLRVEHLKLGDKFILNNLKFEKGKKLRKYYLCRNITNNRQYRVLGVAEIQEQLNEQA
ncbi:MAG: sprT domain-containing protein [Crocinitomicaceae bacterium]